MVRVPKAICDASGRVRLVMAGFLDDLQGAGVVPEVTGGEAGRGRRKNGNVHCGRLDRQEVDVVRHRHAAAARLEARDRSARTRAGAPRPDAGVGPRGLVRVGVGRGWRIEARGLDSPPTVKTPSRNTTTSVRSPAADRKSTRLNSSH